MKYLLLTYNASESREIWDAMDRRLSGKPKSISTFGSRRRCAKTNAYIAHTSLATFAEDVMPLVRG